MAARNPSPVEGIDPARPSPARVYDCLLGGTHHFAADREVAASAVATMPDLPAIMRVNRAFLRRAVRAAAAAGIEQFLDIGSGIPARDAVHEVARAVHPGTRVLYVDSDRSAVIHGRTVTAGDRDTTVLHADLLDADAILTNSALTGLIDLSRPVCLLMAAVLHFVPDSPELYAALNRYRERLATGSYVVVSHGTGEYRPAPSARLAELYERLSAPLVLRDRAAVEKLLFGWDLEPPGLVYATQWRPDPDESPVPLSTARTMLVAIGRRP